MPNATAAYSDDFCRAALTALDAQGQLSRALTASELRKLVDLGLLDYWPRGQECTACYVTTDKLRRLGPALRKRLGWPLRFYTIVVHFPTDEVSVRYQTGYTPQEAVDAALKKEDEEGIPCRVCAVFLGTQPDLWKA